MARIMPGVFMFAVWDRKRSDLHLGVKSLRKAYTVERAPFTQKYLISLAEDTL